MRATLPRSVAPPADRRGDRTFRSIRFSAAARGGRAGYVGPPELYPLSQPVNYVRRGAPPMLLIHGSMDGLVSPWNSRNLASALEALGVPVTLKLYAETGHGDTIGALSVPARGRAATLRDIADFVKSRGAQAAFDAAKRIA